LQRRDSLIAAVDASCQAIAAKRRVNIHKELVNADAPGDCAANIVEALSESCRKHRLAFMPMVSRAYHDSLFMSRITPVGMLFIPCRNGYSHRPDEYASPEDIARGALILAETLGSLAG
jgi:acetylornithine deacetylase/succinyl-diaminopimelate desuccinylase-like protein